MVTCVLSPTERRPFSGETTNGLKKGMHAIEGEFFTKRLLVDLQNETSFSIADISYEENFTGIRTFNCCHWKGYLIGKIENCSSTNRSNRYEEFFTFRSNENFMSIILQKKKNDFLRSSLEGF